MSNPLPQMPSPPQPPAPQPPLRSLLRPSFTRRPGAPHWPGPNNRATARPLRRRFDPLTVGIGLTLLGFGASESGLLSTETLAPDQSPDGLIFLGLGGVLTVLGIVRPGLQYGPDGIRRRHHASGSEGAAWDAADAGSSDQHGGGGTAATADSGGFGSSPDSSSSSSSD